jgi:adenylosuccinate lyase
MGRTHGVHAEPLTFGLKLTTWAFELDRARTRLRAAADDLATGKISGPVGTYSQLPPSIEANALSRLGLQADDASTQVVQRDRHAAFLAAIAVTGGSIERFAVEIRNLQHTELAEVGEPFKRGQTGSSAMPHKRNPILSERLTGMSRLLRGYALSGLEDQALWHERDISHSSVERVALPGATTLLHYMLERFRRLIDGLVVRPERMAQNIERGLGLHCSSRVLTTLVDAGLPRTEAYVIVQRNAMRAYDERLGFRELVEADPEVAATLTPEAIEHCFDDHAWLTHARTVIARLERLDP